MKSRCHKSRCHDCAFTHGTEASNSPHTVVVANMCAITGEVFKCHVNEDEPCQGWAEARAARIASPMKPRSAVVESADMLCQVVGECIRLAKADERAAVQAADQQAAAQGAR